MSKMYQPQPPMGSPPDGVVGLARYTPRDPDPHAANPECQTYGHDTRMGILGMLFTVCCTPCCLAYYLSFRHQVACNRCGATMAPMGLLD